MLCLGLVVMRCQPLRRALGLKWSSYKLKRFVSPPIDQFEKLRQPLTDGERVVFDFFHSNLSLEWEIYVQPHLNGLRPDFVLLHPRAGIAVFEVKDWNLGAMRYEVIEREGKPPILLGERDGKKFSLQSQNPIEKIRLYKEELHELYCPRLDGRASFAAITAGVIFPFSNDVEVKNLFKPSLKYRNMDEYPAYNPISGMSSIQSGNLSAVFPEGKRTYSKFMTEDLAKDLRNWLVEPDFASTQRQPLELDSTQLSFVKTRTKSGYRRIKGPAGSGKSLILAARAAELLGEGKNVLVVTFNITLLHYLMDIAVRWPQSSGKTRKDITWLNFHFLCKRVCQVNDCEEEYKNLAWRENLNKVLNIDLPNLVLSIINSDAEGIITKYDAILVDEGQDFFPSWWGVLRKLCNQNGEMLLVADATQDIYGTASSWTDEAMIGAGFPGGKWAELKTSYRLPNDAIQYARMFAEKYLPKESVDMPNTEQGQLNLFPCTLKWVHTDPRIASVICRDELFLLAKDSEPDVVSIPDITFLSDTNKMGIDVVKEVGNKWVKSCHTYSDDAKESRRKKMGFYMGDARIKATTLHSFKGWESRSMVIFIGQSLDKKALALIYTGLTRLKRHPQGSYLTVVSCAPELIKYGKTWPTYVEIMA
ncbi:NERD domain-containing protein/DEAD/DEAH box helicase [Vibrio cholerae]|nr:NERD domain-containing protein/DEAD/DEAH box helicase [Vibrio cholerae]EKF6289609.1 NERD domain-containing protein/DEAD/DEAH box helicase [Vibrio cholerae]ELU9851224.1 NERD domain-containing protein/DEAD/DEAH box helicase [Vibrio cholerae]ELV3250117.1 NERD domain-containing protein/DEAD/DEAH box helicase [Vibrio cholerae]